MTTTAKTAIDTPVLPFPGWYFTADSNGNVLSVTQNSNDGAIPFPAGISPMTVLPNPNAFTYDGTAISRKPPTLQQAQADQIATLYAAYQQAIQQPVSYTSKGGVTKTYQADPKSVANLTWAMLMYQKAQATPAGFYWVAADNTQVPFTYADLQGLAQALGDPGNAAFQHYQTQKIAVLAATTVSEVQAVTW